MLRIHLANTRLGLYVKEELLKQFDERIEFSEDSIIPTRINPEDLSKERDKANYVVYIFSPLSSFESIARYVEDSCKRGKKTLCAVLTHDVSITGVEVTFLVENFSSLQAALVIGQNNGSKSFTHLSDLIAFLNNTCQTLEENKNE